MLAASSRYLARCFVIVPREVPSTNVGHESIRAVRPFRKIWGVKVCMMLSHKHVDYLVEKKNSLCIEKN